MSVVGNLTKALINSLQKVLKLDSHQKISVTKRNKTLKEGDFVVFIPTGKQDFTESAKGSVEKDCTFATPERREEWVVLVNKRFTVQISADLHIDAWICEVNDQWNKLFVMIDHSQLASFIIEDVLHKGFGYGQEIDSDEEHHSYLISCKFTVHKLEQNPETCTLQDLRTLLTAEHLNSLLCHKGKKSEVASLMCIKTVLKSLFDFENVRHTDEKKDQQLSKAIAKELQTCVSQSEYKVSADKALHGLQKHETECVDLEAFINDLHKTRSINAKTVDMSVTSERFMQVCDLEYLKKQLFHNSLLVNFIHVIPTEVLHQSQQIGLLHEMTFGREDSSSHIHVAVNSVSVRKSTDHAAVKPLPNAKNFLKTRKTQVEEAFVMKYGKKPGDYIKALTAAAVRFEILSTNNLSPLKINLANDQLDTKGGVFLVYNYSRLSTLFENFENAVQSGKYEPLPSHGDIDFNLLQESEEWELVFNYLLMYPAVIFDSIKNLQLKTAKFPIQASKLCQFMQDLSNDFSSYYNRVHILCEPYPHLLPRMHARLYLMKALKQIFLNGLKLLEIEPLDHM